MKNFLDLASERYYEGNPILTDEEFDHLAEKYKYKKVGHQVTDAIPHLFRMYSLQKILSSDIIPEGEYIVSPKWDGAAVSAVYNNGEVEIALTRGDGIQGRDITDKIRLLAPSIKFKGMMQVNAEVVAPKTTSDNPRNFAAGSLNLKSLDVFEERVHDLYFVVHGVHYFGLGMGFNTTYIEDMKELEQWGFRVCINFADIGFPTDGEVWRLNNNKEFNALGYTAHHPRGAYALKEVPKGVLTVLEAVIWQTGKSGIVSPVALLEPVEIGGALVSRATLHNIEYIRALNLEIGCTVEVIRSGEIIPRIVRRVYDEKNNS
ncbi:MAG: DNA ligase [Porticoccaceae bacterium]|nr:DNA ligase [Porticoccaceae bacterium]|tara:strand:- start:180 stop:1133 length:954 start_codon:yes stop_codon:yes gene_type:complete